MIQVEGGWKLCHAGCESSCQSRVGWRVRRHGVEARMWWALCVKMTKRVRACGPRDWVGCWCDGPEGLGARARVGEVVNKRAWGEAVGPGHHILASLPLRPLHSKAMLAVEVVEPVYPDLKAVCPRCSLVPVLSGNCLEKQIVVGMIPWEKKKDSGEVVFASSDWSGECLRHTVVRVSWSHAGNVKGLFHFQVAHQGCHLLQKASVEEFFN